LETLNEMEKVLPDAFEVYDIKAQIYLEQNKFEDALNIINKGCNRFPNDSNLASIKLKVLVLSDRNAEAHEWLDYMKNNNLFSSVNKDASINEATLLIKENKVEEAANVLKKANDIAGDDPDLIYLIADIYGKTAKYDDLIIYSNKLMNEKYGQFYYSTALFYHATAMEEKGEHEEALKEFKDIVVKMRRATINDPSFYEGYLYRLIAYVKLKEYDKALDLADYIENLYPERADGHAYRYFILKEMGKTDEAEIEKQKAKSINSNFNL